MGSFLLRNMHHAYDLHSISGSNMILRLVDTLEAICYLSNVKEKMNKDDFQPGLSVDCVVFGFHERELKVLILKLKDFDLWSLPGGFVNKDQDVDTEALKVLKWRTGLESVYMKQFHVFGEVGRDRLDAEVEKMRKNFLDPDIVAWFDQRFITIGYYGLVEYSMVKNPQPDFFTEKCEWCTVSDLPKLIFDHEKIIRKAHDTLKKALNYEPIGLNLLPREFTMTELQALYETLLGRELDRRNFRRKMLGYGILKSTDKRRTGGAHKAPLLYEFDQKKYNQAIIEGLNTGW